MNRAACAWLFVVALCLSTAGRADPTFIFDPTNNYLTGISGVSIGGTIYNVEFVRGSYLDIFSTESPPTFLNDFDGAYRAKFATWPPDYPLVGPSNQYMIPYLYDAASGMVTSTFQCFEVGEWHPHPTDFCPSGITSPLDILNAPSGMGSVVRLSDTYVTSYAVFSTVPEPETLALLGLLFASLGCVQYRRRD